MEIVRASLTPLRLPLRLPLATAHGVTRVREGTLLRLETRDGARGHGEALPLPGFALESLAASRAALVRAARALVGRQLPDLETALDRARSATPRAPSARAALDCALHDLAGQRRGVPVSVLLGAGRATRAQVPVGALLAAKTPREAGRAAREAVARGHRTVKLKVAATTIDRDVARAEGVREAIGDDVALRLDANGGWSEAEAREALARLAPLKPEYVEQPVPADDLDALARLSAEAPVPVAADESACGEAAQAVLQRRAVDVIVVKPAAVGGLRSARRLIEAAERAEISVVVTGFLDSAIGDAAALHLASTLGGPRRAAGLGTGDLLQTDLHSAPEPGAWRAVPTRAGLGVEPDPARLSILTCGTSLEIVC
jgi:o-succinylbenzoate synthase